jgi:dienelactone hydrolase
MGLGGAPFMIQHLLRHCGAACVLGIAAVVPARAAEVAAVPAAASAPLSIEDAFKPGGVRQVRIAPGGKHLAVLATVGQTSAVILVDTADLGTSMLVPPVFRAERPPRAVDWVDASTVAVRTPDRTDFYTLSGEVTASLRGRFIKTVTPDEKGRTRVLMRAKGFDIERRVLATGDNELMNYDMPGTPTRWMFDGDGVPVVVTTRSTAFWSGDTTISHWYRPTLRDRWQLLARFPLTQIEWEAGPLAKDGRSMAVSSRRGGDFSAIYRYSFAERQVQELMAGHPTQDILFAQEIDDEDSDEYQRVMTAGMRPETHWFDAPWARLQASVDATLPGRVNMLSGDVQDKVVVGSYGDVDPGRWYVLDVRTMTLRFVLAARPHIDPARMRPMQVVHYKSLDGLEIPAFLTLPSDRPGPFPTIVMIHGGPVVRDAWEWNPEVQMLASRGYAVLQPQFRGSAGFGVRFEQAGHQQWGRAMQDDVTAGAQWLVSQGIAKAAGMCIYGGSYGGYAATWALAKTPELFACGASFAGVTDIYHMATDDSDTNDNRAAMQFQRLLIGDVKARRESSDEVSPVVHAGRIRAPLLLAHGDRDRRVPISHGELLVKAMKAKGREPEWIVLKGEGHGIAKPENQKLFYEALFRFFDRHIGSGAAP